MKIQTFSGGINKRTRPQFLQLSQAVALVNCDTTKGTLLSALGPANTDLELDQYMFWFREEAKWLSAAVPTSYLEYQGTVYTADGVEPRRIKGIVDAKLGIANPTSNDFDSSIAAGPGQANGTYTYVMTFYNSAEGIESGPCAPTAELTVASPDHYIQHDDLPVSADPQVDQKKLYRIGGSLTAYSLVVTLPNATTTYSDTLADNAIVGDVLTTATYLPAPDTITHLAQYNGMLFGADGMELRFTPIGVPTAWPIFFGIKYPHTVVGTVSTANGLLVLTSKQTYLVSGSNPAQLASRLIDSTQGCVSWESIQEYSNGGVWVSNSGVCFCSGGQVKVVTQDMLGTVSLSTQSSVIVDNVYYALDSSGVTLAVDTRYGMTFSEYVFDVSSLAAKENELFGWTADGVVQLLSNDQNLMPFSYTSPRFIEGSFVENKSYKKIYIFAEGDIIIKVLIDNKEVVEKLLTGTDKHTVLIPETVQRGFFIQFQLSGTGEVHELEYTVGAKQQ